MDGFTDRLAQRLSAQDMITANAQAEAQAKEALEQKVQEATQQNEEDRARMAELLTKLEERIEQVSAPEGDGGATADSTVSRIQEFSHRENIKVYRNVQASLIEELNKQTEALQAVTEQLIQAQTAQIQEISEAVSNQDNPAQSEALTKMGETVAHSLKRQSDDLHAQMDRILTQQKHLEEQMDVIMNDLQVLRMQELKGRKNTGVIVLEVMILLAVFADIAIGVLRILGIM